MYDQSGLATVAQPCTNPKLVPQGIVSAVTPREGRWDKAVMKLAKLLKKELEKSAKKDLYRDGHYTLFNFTYAVEKRARRGTYDDDAWVARGTADVFVALSGDVPGERTLRKVTIREDAESEDES